MKLPRRNFLHLAAGAAALPTVSRFAWAQTYPTRPVRLIVPVAPGGAYDITARLIGQWLSERLCPPFVIDNRPGGGTNIGTEAVVRAPADGYTLLLVGAASAINATLYDKLNFNFIRDIAPVAGITRAPEVMVVHPSVPAKTIPEFIAYAKANPGKLTMASGGIGSLSHVAGGSFIIVVGGARGSGALCVRGVGRRRLLSRAGTSRSCSPALAHQLIIPRLPGCARTKYPRRRARPRCRTSRPWLSSCSTTRRVIVSASPHKSLPPPRSSTSSTRRSTLALPKP